MTEEVPKPGSIVHVEIPCKNRENAKKFYGEVFDWKFEDVPEMDYTLFEPSNPPGGGLFTPTESTPSGVLNYLLVDSIQETSQAIEEAGGKILVPESEVPNQGWFAIFQDPEDNVLAIWKNAPRQEE
ncbi:MAG: VOC family protein [Candidatus Thermoplasmatota archaeon]|nr:VOC family protein [Candidatus Thermoplasmatota archaeon]